MFGPSSEGPTKESFRSGLDINPTTVHLNASLLFLNTPLCTNKDGLYPSSFLKRLRSLNNMLKMIQEILNKLCRKLDYKSLKSNLARVNIYIYVTNSWKKIPSQFINRRERQYGLCRWQHISTAEFIIFKLQQRKAPRQSTAETSKLIMNYKKNTQS